MDNDAAPSDNHTTNNNDASVEKGKGKGKVTDNDESMEVEEEEEEEYEESGEEESEEEGEEDYKEIDPSAILPAGARRTRGKKVDYTSPEALAKAGLKPEAPHDDDTDDEHVVHDEDPDVSMG